MHIIDRRAFIASGAALGVASVVRAEPPAGAKVRAIDSLPLPLGFNGLLAYGRGGRVQHLRCAGFADVEARRPVTAATQFKWGSASKWLTSVAVLRLVEQGSLALDDPITGYLPTFRADTGSRVHLSHLLSNTSGIPDLLSRQIAAEPQLRTSAATSAEIVARFGNGDLAFTPGAGWDYAALNWAIVAAIVSRVTGEPLPAAVRRLVFQPLKMTGAGFAQADQPAMPQLAVAYTGTLPLTRKMAPVPPFIAASGNVAGTVNDAMRAAHGVFQGSLLRAAARRELTSVRWPEQDYALGGRVHAIDGESWAWEAGKVGGYRTHIAHRLSASETIVIFNTTDMLQSTIGDWVEAIARA
jgi:CubicO group peptidase (beta-lactamase class C family)